MFDGKYIFQGHPKYIHQWMCMLHTPMDTCLNCGKRVEPGHKCKVEGLSKADERLIICVLCYGFEAKDIRYMWE